MKILYLNNDGAGFADFIEVAPGTTVDKFVSEKVTGKPSDYLIRVNRQPVSAGYTLQEGDRVSVTPVKIEGAICCQVA
jgi:sulfur carrier protein ThiS